MGHMDEYPSRRGVWRCRTDHAAGSKETAAYTWVKTGKIVRTEGCGHWNVYVSNIPIAKDDPNGKRKVNIRCKKCKRRHRFMLSRVKRRGRRRTAVYQRRPPTMPMVGLIEEVKERNRFERKQTGFITAKELRANENTRMRDV